MKKKLKNEKKTAVGTMSLSKLIRMHSKCENSNYKNCRGNSNEIGLAINQLTMRRKFVRR